jgi:hypothetical protein
VRGHTRVYRIVKASATRPARPMLKESLVAFSMAHVHGAGARLALRGAYLVAALIGHNAVAAADDALPSAPPTARTPPLVPSTEPADEGPPALDNHLQAIVAPSAEWAGAWPWSSARF